MNTLSATFYFSLAKACIRHLTLISVICLLFIAMGWPGGASYAADVTSSTPAKNSSQNSSTAPDQPGLTDVSGTGAGSNATGNGAAATCSTPTGQPCAAGGGNPINVMTGNKYQREEDLAALPGKLGIEIVRHYNSLHMGLGHIGYGWRLSYEIDLIANPRSIHISQADGSQIIFNRSMFNPGDCACQDLALGHVMIYHTALGDEYTWYQTDGQQLHFNHLGKLERITAATGESVHLTRGLKGELLKVTDPQGRSLVMHYADKNSLGFKGIIAIDTPVGRFAYQHNNDIKSPGISNLTEVSYPATAAATAFSKHYHYGETAYVDAHMVAAQNQRPYIPHAAHLLTGISYQWPDTSGKTTTTRQRTWQYDQYGRGILSVHGTPDSKTATQQVQLSYRVAPIKPIGHLQHTKQPSPTQPYPRITHNGQIGQTVITNSAGQTTTYNYTLIAGQYRLLQILGAGCSECATPNITYGYDKLGRQTDITQVGLTGKQNRQGKPIYQALSTMHTDFDQSGRVSQISRIAYRNGQAQAPQLQVRYSYANTPVFPQLKQARRAAQEPIQIFNQPSLIAKPSVIAGKEHQWHIIYNQAGQPITVTETGYSPVVPVANSTADNQPAQRQPADNKITKKSNASRAQISRTTHYTYTTINGRSLLAQTDGPLANGNTNTPQDSDITQYQYDKLGQYLTKVITPGQLTTQLSYDLEGMPDASSEGLGGTGRLVKRVSADSTITEVTYALNGGIISTQRHPAALNAANAKRVGLLQTSAMAYDVFGNTTMVKRADGQTMTMQYGTDGKLAVMKDGFGNRVEWKDWYKAPHDSDRTVTTQQWFTADAPETVARAWYFWHDDQQRLTQRLSPDGGIDTWRYSDTHNRDTDKNQQQEATSYASWVQHIDPLNRMTLSATNSQAATQIRMTPAGYVDASFQLNTGLSNKQQTINTKSQPTQIADDFGRIIQFNSSQHGTSTATYNAANLITHIIQADGTHVDYRYDVSGRILSKTAVPASVAKTTSNQAFETIKYAYNAFGLQQIQDAHQTISYQHDLLGREIDKTTILTLQNQPSQKNQTRTYNIRTRYDEAGRIKAKQLIDGQWLVFTPNNKTGLTKAMHLHKTLLPGLTNTLADWLNLPDLPLQVATTKVVVNDITLHPFNGITHLTHGNGISDDYSFDIAGRLTSVRYGKHLTALASAPAGFSTPVSPLIHARYTYDAGRRLTAENISMPNMPGSERQYAYTGWNQLATAPQAGFVKAVGKSSAQRLSKHAINSNVANLTAATLDAAGRTTRDARLNYTYNVWGKLSAVQTHTNLKTIARYQTNALGERIMASYPESDNSQVSQTRYYLYDHQQRIAELDEHGNILQQYLYINQTPVAVISTPSAGEAEVIAIHADRRHSPIAATDEQGKVVWQTQYDAWGKAINVSQSAQTHSQNTFKLALRLPGQWEDAVTHIHYNYQRDYNPSTGKYLTPDPQGFPDGKDPYAYVNNDPLNKLDPLGLYQSDIHYYMTFFLAVAAGVPVEDARTIALATQYVDDNDDTRPINLNGLDDHRARLLTYHFTAIDDIKIDPATGKVSGKLGEYGNPSVDTNTGVRPSNDQLTRLLQASETAKRCLTKNAELQFFGEYLHAFEDTFAHRDQNNNPFALNVGLGHGGYGSDPDYTYNHWGLLPTPTNWGSNASRTYSMELLVFLEMRKYATGNDVIAQGKITEQDFNQLLKDFNAIDESEGDGFLPQNPSSSIKINKLQDELDKWFGKDVIKLTALQAYGYDVQTAEAKRQDYLCENGKSLDQKVYEGTILPTKCN
jgi:RHS repeat-associated protein